jgi:Txe/YoeB family toxin of Txe-Axe toxin-antitoxin module
LSKGHYVGFADEKVKESYEKLSKTGEGKELLKFIDRAVDDLKKDPLVGIKIPYGLWPKVYIKKYNIKNLRKYDLPNGWRLVYTIKEDEVIILSIILEWFNHKEYEKRFGYHKK